MTYCISRYEILSTSHSPSRTSRTSLCRNINPSEKSAKQENVSKISKHAKKYLVDMLESISRADLFLAKLADLLLHHGYLSVYTVHVLDQLLLGEASRHQVQVRVHMDWAHRGDWLQFPHGISTLLQKHNREKSDRCKRCRQHHSTLCIPFYTNKSQTVN